MKSARLKFSTRTTRKPAHFQNEIARQDPYPWYRAAEYSKESAIVLWEKYLHSLEAQMAGTPVDLYSYSATALMLFGFAIENLLKAVLIRDHKAFSTSGKFLIGHHNLLELAVDAGIPLDDMDRAFLERLENYVLWAGRYPIPKLVDNLFPREHPEGEGPLTFVSSNDGTRFDKLFLQILSVLGQPEQLYAEYAKRSASMWA